VYSAKATPKFVLHDNEADRSMTHPAIAPGRTAVITGAASGIGLAAAQRLVHLGMSVCMADTDEAALQREAAALAEAGATVLAVPTDVSQPSAMTALRDRVIGRFGAPAVLINNAGREGGGSLTASLDRWHAIIDTNLWGVLHGVQAFMGPMVEAGTPGLIINTGSKQGITTPPGDTAYNVSKAGIKVLTEALAHDLRATGAPITAHLLIPGFTFTGFTRARTDTQPEGAWLPDQVIDFMLEGLDKGDFYILCPDGQTTRDQDEKRIRWAADDIILNRPALSRWHPAFADAFRQYMEG
jgi:NAD(P)-dependent dehydrogenase (short-subunit alcohol dehydrogenase family)